MATRCGWLLIQYTRVDRMMTMLRLVERNIKVRSSQQNLKSYALASALDRGPRRDFSRGKHDHHGFSVILQCAL